MAFSAMLHGVVPELQLVIDAAEQVDTLWRHLDYLRL